MNKHRHRSPRSPGAALAIVAIIFGTGLVTVLTAEESVDYYLDLYHQWFDPPIETAVYVFQETTGAIVDGAQVGIKTGADAARWVYDRRGEIGEFVVITYNQTAQEARELWEEHADEVGEMVLVVADEASEAMEDFYAAGTKAVSNLVIIYAENEDRIHEFMGSVAENVRVGVVYVAVTGKKAGEAALAAGSQLADEAGQYYQAHKDEFHAALHKAYVWTGDRLVDVSNMAKDEWLPAGIAAMEQAEEYLREHEDEIEAATEAAIAAVSGAVETAYVGVVTGMDRLWEDHQNKIIALGLYAQDKGEEAGDYLMAEGQKTYEAVARTSNRYYQWGKETMAEYYEDVKDIARETDWEEVARDYGEYVYDRVQQIRTPDRSGALQLVDDEVYLNSVSELGVTAQRSAERAWQEVTSTSGQWSEEAAETASQWAKEASEWSQTALDRVRTEETQRRVRQAADQAVEAGRDAARAAGDAIQSTVRSVQDDAGQAVETSVRNVQEQAGDAAHAAGEAIDSTVRNVQETAGDAARTAGDAIDSTVRSVQEQAGRAVEETARDVQRQATETWERTSRDVQRQATETWEQTSRDVQRRASDAMNSVGRTLGGLFGN